MRKEMKYLLCLVLVVVLVNLIVPLVIKTLVDVNHPRYGKAVNQIHKLVGSPLTLFGDKLLLYSFASSVMPVVSSLVLVVFVVASVLITRAIC